MAWLALALERAGRLAGVEQPEALEKLADQFLNSWVPEDGGGIPWRKQDQFFNAPANGPAGIFLARYDDRLRRAQQMADWIDETLIDPETHLVFDGIKAGSLVRAQYTYCQGVVLGLEIELAARTEDPHARAAGTPAGGGGARQHGARRRHPGCGWRRRRAVRTASPRAISRWSPRRLPERTADDTTARATAKELVFKSAQSAWDYRQTVDGLPLFGAFWDRSADVPKAAGKDAQFVEGAVNASEIPERDLSVQVAGWMLMEAAHTVADERAPEPQAEAPAAPAADSGDDADAAG